MTVLNIEMFMAYVSFLKKNSFSLNNYDNGYLYCSNFFFLSRNCSLFFFVFCFFLFGKLEITYTKGVKDIEFK